MTRNIKLKILWSDGSTSESMGLYKAVEAYFIGIRFHFGAMIDTVKYKWKELI